mmetsp:Transcript_12827/g.34531  ORF Transcript_12827/g.34531 Transcript_12827/m.34531 type:complete len:163 (+) Transcript_12827:147-635(+)
MAAVVGAGAVACVSGAVCVAVKAASEWQRARSGECAEARAMAGSVFAMANGNNVLARQGRGVPDMPGAGDKLARQRAAGIKGGVETREQPSFLDKVPNKGIRGNLKENYTVGKLGNATSSQGNLPDILAKVPKKPNGTPEYQRIARPPPSRQAGFGNSSFPG